MKVLQIVGYKNSGKTTLVEKLIKEASNQGYKVGAVKHHGHGGYPDIQDSTNDSNKHRQAGAVVSCVEGNGLLQIQAVRNKWTLNEILQFYSFFPLDFIVVEGFKMEMYPKVVMIRTIDDLPLLSQLENIIAVISWEPLKASIKASYPIFLIDNERQYVQWLMNYVRDVL
jgi:molybdopterin-guanine dinucleotide biosynthesis adapter protein